MTPRIPRDLIKHLEWRPGLVVPATPPVPPVVVSPSAVNSMDDFWTISGVQYRGESCTVDLMKKLLADGAAKTQAAWATDYQNARDTNEFHTPDFPILYGLVKALHNARDDATQATQVAEAKKFLKDTSRAKWLTTLTRIAYQPSGEDLVIHNFGTSDSYEQRTAFAGNSEWLKDTSNLLAYQKLLGTQDDKEVIGDVFKWLNDTGTYLWRINRPDTIDERVARFVAYSGSAYLYCDWGASFSDASLGVRVVRENFSRGSS